MQRLTYTNTCNHSSPHITATTVCMHLLYSK